MKAGIQFQKKIVCLFLIAFALLVIPVNAQIVYTDLIPDSLIHTTGGVYHLDLNNDGINDFNLNLTFSTIPAGHCHGTKINHSVRVSPIDTILDWVANRLNYPTPITADTIINDTNLYMDKQ